MFQSSTRKFVTPQPVPVNEVSGRQEPKPKTPAELKAKAEGNAKGGKKRDSLCIPWWHRLQARTDGRWCIDADKSSEGAVVYRWTGRFWDTVVQGEGHAKIAKWAYHAYPACTEPRHIVDAWRYGLMMMRGADMTLPRLATPRAFIPCSDAYLEVTKHGIEVLAPDPEYGLTYAVSVAVKQKSGAYRKTPLHPEGRFKKYLDQALPDLAVRALAQEICGMTLLPGCFQMAGWFYGTAGSGKSTLMELLEAMHARVCRMRLETLDGDFALEPLIGASLVLVDEVPDKGWAESMFKTLVSGNGVTVNRKKISMIQSYHSMAKWIISSNSPPFVRDKSDGVWRRICPIYFAHQVPDSQRIADLHKVILQHESKEVLDWMLEGAQRIVQRGGFAPQREWPKAVIDARNRIRNGTDSIRSWIETGSVVVDSGDTWLPKHEVYERYAAFCHIECVEALDHNSFWRECQRTYWPGIQQKAFRAAKGRVKSVRVSWKDPVTHDPSAMLMDREIREEEMQRLARKAKEIDDSGIFSDIEMLKPRSH